ncbi:MAG TPA: FG-GAP-like repeat-containing protein, partial [Hanamia sp.]|nr:FG-GAP-like repeat-containing protein [Hanamia sp.]
MKKSFFLLISFLLTLNLFSQPVIHSFSPLSGPVGTTVLIEGAGFRAAANENFVYFGAAKAVIQSATDTTLTVVVPAGATFQPVTVTAGNLTAYSVNSFIITYTGGSGSFNAASLLPKANLTTGIYPHSVCLSDFNGDGKPDLLVSRGSSSNISVFANTSIRGTLSFGSQIDFPGLGRSHEGSATSDLDGDGKPDVVIANSYNTASVSVYRNTSVGATISFASKIDYAADDGPYNVAIGDIDGDGKPDLLLANNGSNVVSFYKNTGNPGNISFAARVDFAAGTNPYSVALSDLDGDGKSDLVVTTQGSSSALSVMKNTTDSGKVSFDSPVNYATSAGLFIVSIGDLDGDGLPDLAAASSSSNSVVVLKNVSTHGNLSFYSASRFTTGTYPVCVAMADIDGDGKPDLVTSNQQSNNISLLRNTSSSANISFETHVDYAAGANPIFVAIGDLDGDGRPDIVNANSSADVVSVFRNIIGTNIAPVIHSFTPVLGIKGTVVTITGANFTDASSVKFGGVEAASFKVDSASAITAIVGEGKSGEVTVTTPNGTAALAGFFFQGPIIDNFTPTTGNPGTEVTISGSNLSDVSEVKFGGTPASSFSLVSANGIKAIVAAGSAGEVSVTTPYGTATLGGFTFGAPTITSIAPES